MRQSICRFLLGVAATVALVACDSDPLAPSEVVGGTWTLVSLQESGAAAVVVDNPPRYTLQLNNEGQMLVRSDCNSCGGSYALKDSSLEVGPLACTKAYCGDASLDAPYTTMLQGARSIVVSDDQLVILGNGTLRFRR
jgi:heat shock protein HslJ